MVETSDSTKNKKPINLKDRIFLAGGILVVDLVFFMVPLTAIFLIYVIVVNPPWVREFMDRFAD